MAELRFINIPQHADRTIRFRPRSLLSDGARGISFRTSPTDDQVPAEFQLPRPPWVEDLPEEVYHGGIAIEQMLWVGNIESVDKAEGRVFVSLHRVPGGQHRDVLVEGCLVRSQPLPGDHRPKQIKHLPPGPLPFEGDLHPKPCAGDQIALWDFVLARDGQEAVRQVYLQHVPKPLTAQELEAIQRLIGALAQQEQEER